MRLIPEIKFILFHIFSIINFVACNYSTLSGTSPNYPISTPVKSDSTLHILNSLSSDSLLSILQLPADLSNYDSIENLEMQNKIYATRTGKCEEMVLANFDLIASDSENAYTVFFLIKFNHKQWIVSKPLTFESAGGVDFNYSLRLEDDTRLNTGCSTMRIFESYEDEEVSYQRYIFYLLNQAGEFTELFMYTPSYQLSSATFIDGKPSGKKHNTVITETLQVLPGFHGPFKDITLSVAKQEGSVTSHKQTTYRYNVKISTYTEIRN